MPPRKFHPALIAAALIGDTSFLRAFSSVSPQPTAPTLEEMAKRDEENALRRPVYENAHDISNGGDSTTMGVMGHGGMIDVRRLDYHISMTTDSVPPVFATNDQPLVLHRYPSRNLSKEQRRAESNRKHQERKALAKARKLTSKKLRALNSFDPATDSDIMTTLRRSAGEYIP